MLQRTERKDAAKHRELILETATHLFDTKGVDSVSMHQIAKTAGIGQGTLYRRYSSKADLCMELLMDSFQRFTNDINQYLYNAAQRPVRERLGHFLAKWIDYIASNFQWLNAIKSNAICSEDRIKIYHSPAFTYVTAILIGLLEEAITQKQMPPINTDFAAFNVASSLSPEAFLFLHNDRNMSLEQIKEHFSSFYLELLFRSTQ